MSTRFENGFDGRVAVVTGGGTGMGREMVLQLTANGCDVATCDISEENLTETAALCAAAGNKGQLITHIADVSVETEVLAFRDVVARWRQHVNLLFNNAGIAQGYSFVTGERADWDKTFAVCWFGVYYNTRAFLDLLIAAPVAHIINTSSINGFWASIGPARSHTAYSAAKFAVKGFTEALMTDLRLNAPHVHASVVMPGHIGTSIILNANKIFGREPKEMSAEQLVIERERLTKFGLDVSAASDEDLRVGLQALAEGFRDQAPMTAKDATAVILDAVRHDKWRILVGEDAKILDEMVRQDPQGAYSIEFFDMLNERGILGGLTGGLAAQPPVTP